MKQKIIYLVLLLVGMHLLASSKQCAGVVKLPGGSKQEVSKPVSKEDTGIVDDDIPGYSLSPVSMLLFKL